MDRFLEDNGLLINEVLEAIAHFIERQKLVAQVMRDLDIDLDDVGEWGSAIWSQQGVQEPLPSLPTSASDEAREFWKAVQRAKLRRPVTQQGNWASSEEWAYFLHGNGCRLRNSLTGEVIDWHCPNVESFDPYSFLDHLRWRLEVEGEYSLKRIREWVSSRTEALEESILELLNQMVEDGLINSDWTLSELGNLNSSRSA
jgi:hypothetical protein